MSENYTGEDRRAGAPEPAKAWYQTFGNNIGQWVTIGGVILAGVTMFSDFQTKSAVREAKIDSRLDEMGKRDERIEQQQEQSERRRLAEKQEFINQVNTMVGQIQTDIRAIRDRLDRGR